MDRTLIVPNFLIGRRHRASGGVTLPGGKGVNIARALKRLGEPVIATGMAGGLTGANIVERLTDEGILNDFVRIAEPTRTSSAVIDPVSGVHTEINEYGPRVQPGEVAVLLEKLRYLARASRCVILAGTLPRDVDHDVYQRILRMLQSMHVDTVVSSPDDPEVLRFALQGEPSMTIIEQREAESLVGHEFTSDDDFLIGVDEMARVGGQTIVITHETGAYVRAKQGKTVSYLSGSHDPVEAVSALGSADVFVAGWISASYADRKVPERLAHALAVSLANMRALGAGVFEPADVQRLADEVSTRTLEPVELDLEN